MAGIEPCNLSAGSADITPDGQLLACIGTSQQSISITSLNPLPGSEITRIVTPEAANSVSWSPDGHTLAVATSLNSHRVEVVHLYAYDAAKTAFTLKEVLEFPSTVLSRHAGDDPVIRSIAWAPNGKHLALHVHAGDLTDYVTLVALSRLGPPDTTATLPTPAGPLLVPAVIITQLEDLAAPAPQWRMIWTPTSDALLVSVNATTLARLEIATNKLTTVLRLPVQSSAAIGEITVFAPFPSHDRLVFVYSGEAWATVPRARVYVYSPAP